MKKDQKPPLALTEEQRAFIEDLITENKAVIYYTIRGTLGEVYEYLTDDCVSELYLLACTKISALKAHPKPKAWLIVASRLTAFSAIKESKPDLNSVPLEMMGSTEIDTTYEEALFEIWSQNNAPQKLISTLTKNETLVYHKLFVENKSINEAAKDLSLSPSAIRSFKKLIKDKIKWHVKKNI